MERLTLNRRHKTIADKVKCITAGDGLPVWTTISLDAKLPMMPSPKGSVVLYTTKLGVPKHTCKQAYDFDLRDPNSHYVSNEYQPLHDPNLKSYFSTHQMRRELIKKGFISQDGQIICSMKELNQYRHYLGHIYFLEIAKERRIELGNRLNYSSRREAEIPTKMSRGAIVRRRLQQQRNRDVTKIKKEISQKSFRLENNVNDICDEMKRREGNTREEAERRRSSAVKCQQEDKNRNLMTMKKLRQRDQMRTILLEDRETQRRNRAELKCMANWNARKEAQTQMLEKNNELLKQEDEVREQNISKREQIVVKGSARLAKKMETLKQTAREAKQKRDEVYMKRLDETRTSGDHRIWSRRKEKSRSPKKTFCSAWKLKNVLSNFELSDIQKERNDPACMATLNTAVSGDVYIASHTHQEDNPHDIQLLGVEMKGENEAVSSKSVRFSPDEGEIISDNMVSSIESHTKGTIIFKPVSDHIVTPCASQIEVTKFQTEAVLGLPDKTSSASFVETLLLRLLNDLNSGRLSNDDIMKLSSYAMDIIQSAEVDGSKDDSIADVPKENDDEGPYLASSSSSIIAKHMVDFTLSKILSDIQHGNVHHEDLASLTVYFLDSNTSDESSISICGSEPDLSSYSADNIYRAMSSALDSRDDSPVCEALLENFIVVSLKNLIKDLEAVNVDLMNVEAKEDGNKIIECGKRLVKSSILNSSSTDIVTEDVVKDVIRNLQLEIESGVLSKGSLKDIAKVVMDTTSISDTASEAVKEIFKGIYRDVDRGYQPDDILSVPTVTDSPSASSIASYVVIHTIYSIIRDISNRGIPQSMTSSVASFIVAKLSGDKLKRLDDNLPQHVKRFKPNISNIIDCLRGDQVSQVYANEMFCIILEKYRECVLCHTEHDIEQEEQLPDEAVELINNLVMETLHNVERCVAKGQMDNIAFSIPSMPHSDDTSVMASDLIDTCMCNIRRDMADVQSNHDIVDFILEIVIRLQSKLDDGTISSLSMAHFFQAISDEQMDMKILKTNASPNLAKVILDIRRCRGNSEYVHRILERYLIPDKSADEVFGDPLKAIEEILINISSEINTKFVNATIQTILMEMRDDSLPIQERVPSAYVLRFASSIIAEKVIQEVIRRIKEDMTTKIRKIHGTVSKQDIERAASRLLSESPRHATKTSSANIMSEKPSSKQSTSSVLSKEVEDIVLETLHNNISNLRLEQSIKSEKGSKSNDIETSTSQEIDDFVLNTLQNIVVDQQDKRSQIDLDVPRMDGRYAGSSVELISGESKEAMVYVNEILHSVLEEMKKEVKESDEISSGMSLDADSVIIQTMILDCLQRTMSDTQAPYWLDASFQLFHPDDIRRILLESITGTMSNIGKNKFTSSNLSVMYKAAIRFLGDVEPDNKLQEDAVISPELIVKLMDQIKTKVERMELQEKSFGNISSQLAILGMEPLPLKRTSPAHVKSESSVESSLISNLIKDVFVRISHQTQNDISTIERNEAQCDNTDAAADNTQYTAESITRLESKSSKSKQNVNSNRRFSEFTADSQISETEIIVNSDQTNNDYKQTNKDKSNTKRRDESKWGLPLHVHANQILRRSTLSKPLIRQSKTPSKADSSVQKRSIKPCRWLNSSNVKLQQILEAQLLTDVCYVENKIEKEVNKLMKQANPQFPVNASNSEKKTIHRKQLAPMATSMPAKKSTCVSKSPNQSGAKHKSTTKAEKMNLNVCIPAINETVGWPLEMESLCGIHRAKTELHGAE